HICVCSRARSHLPPLSLHDALPIYRAGGAAVLVDLGRDRGDHRDPAGVQEVLDRLGAHLGDLADVAEVDLLAVNDGAAAACGEQDRKSTRLNSSHVKTSYAVFCLKK